MPHALNDVIVSVMALGMLAQWLAWRFQFPAIILLALTGLLIGPILGWIHPAADLGDEGLRTIINLGVAIILFEGGLSLRVHELKEAAAGVKRLVTLGVLLNLLFATLAARHVAGLSWAVSMVLGAILVVTGPTVIMPLLRHALLNRRTASYLKWEAIINDPVGALLAVVVFQYFVLAGDEGSAAGALLNIVQAAGIAATLGGGGGYFLARVFRAGLVPEFLKSPVLLAAMLALFTLSNRVQADAGLLTVTILGVVMANMRLPDINGLRRHKEYVTILLVSTVFILLTADLQTDTLAQLDWRALAFVLAILFVVRPAAVLLATVGSGMPWRDRLLVGWIGPRGIVAAAVAGLFAPEMIAAGYADADMLVPLVFAVIFATILFHGLSLRFLARRLALAPEGPRNGVLIIGGSPWTIELARCIHELGIRTLIADDSWHRLRPARLAGLPVYFGEILSERAEESLQFQDLGHLIAATSNDAYNALVCSAFTPELGADHVLQLSLGIPEQDDRRRLSAGVRGRVAFHPDATFEELWRRHHEGWRFQKTRFTESFTYTDYCATAADERIPILLISPSQEVTLCTSRRGVRPRQGDVLVSYAPCRPVRETTTEHRSATDQPVG